MSRTIRPAVLAAAVVAVVSLALLGAACFPDDSPRISIEYGMIPELEGADVLIDGKVVGKLEMTGQATRVSFAVKPGEHEVCIREPRFDCQPARVAAELKGQKIRLMAQIAEMASTTGKPTITFMY